MKLTKEEKEEIKIINQMSHYDMCNLWRNAPTGHRYFDNTKPYVEVFKKRLFNHFGGFTSEISKEIGW